MNTLNRMNRCVLGCSKLRFSSFIFQVQILLSTNDVTHVGGEEIFADKQGGGPAGGVKNLKKEVKSFVDPNKIVKSID